MERNKMNKYQIYSLVQEVHKSLLFYVLFAHILD